MKGAARGAGQRNGVWLRRALDTRYVITPRSATPAGEERGRGRGSGWWRSETEGEEASRRGGGATERESLTDLHKGTHNCAAAIRESGAGISSPSLAPPTPAFLHPRSGSQPPQTTLGHPVGASKGTGGGQKHGHSVSTLLSFFHTSGRRRRWFLGGTTLLLPSCPLLFRPASLSNRPLSLSSARSPRPARSKLHTTFLAPSLGRHALCGSVPLGRDQRVSRIRQDTRRIRRRFSLGTRTWVYGVRARSFRRPLTRRENDIRRFLASTGRACAKTKGVFENFSRRNRGISRREVSAVLYTRVSSILAIFFNAK